MFWSYLDQMGQELGRSPRFPDAESAEAWIGTAWHDLRESGIEEVVLYEGGGRRLYRMALDASSVS
jgi:hypothetical protein